MIIHETTRWSLDSGSSAGSDMRMRKGEVFLACAIVFFSLALPPAKAVGEGGCRDGPCHRSLDEGEVSHAPFLDGRCGACHEGSGSKHPSDTGREFSLAYGGGSELCFSCHEGMAGRIAKSASVHTPVTKGACLDCHDAHASSFAGLLTRRMTGDSSPGLPARGGFSREDFSLCWACHDVYMVALRKTTSRTGFRSGAQNLHYVHVSGEKGYTCRACHMPHASQGEMLIGRPLGWTGDLVRYSRRPGGGECSPGCHEPRSYSRGE